MQAFLYLLPVLAIFAPTSATPTRSLERQASLCGEQDTESTGAFTLSTDEWGESSGTGSQCAQINSYDDGSLAWSTTWSWADNMNNVKAFTNVQSSSTYCEQISAISSIPTSWSWSYSGDSLRANVVYDTFAGSSCGGSQDYEIMVWLGFFGDLVYPLSNSGYPPSPTATPTIGGTEYNLVIGSGDGTTVYSFLSTYNDTSYSGNLMDFYNYLDSNGYISGSDYIQLIQAGTEALTGSDCDFSTSSYTISQS